MKTIFIGYNNKDKALARFIYHQLCRHYWPDINIFMDEFSIHPGEDWKLTCIKQAKKSNLGIFILSEYTHKSEYVPQEIGILLTKNIPLIYVATHDEFKIPPGYGKTVKSFPLFEHRNPFVGLENLTEWIIDLLCIKVNSEINKSRQKFENELLLGQLEMSFPYRDRFLIVSAMKCAVKEIKILGENALQPIHGGFEHLYRLLRKGGYVSILLLNYNSDIYRKREEIESSGMSKRVRADWISSISNLIELERMREENGSLSVKVHSTESKGSLIIIDDWLIQYNPYEPAGKGQRRGAGHEVHVWLNRGDLKTKFSDYFEMFQTIWEHPLNVELKLKEINVENLLPDKFDFL